MAFQAPGLVAVQALSQLAPGRTVQRDWKRDRRAVLWAFVGVCSVRAEEKPTRKPAHLQATGSSADGTENPGVGGSIPSQPTILLSYLPTKEFLPI